MAVNIPIRWADNTKDLVRNLKEGTGQIEATRASAEKLAQSLGGDKLIAAAHRYAAAIQEIGGVEKLTTSERDRANVVLQKALDKYQALGKDAPTALRQLAQETATASKSTDDLLSSASKLVGTFAGLGISAGISTFIALGKSALDDADALTKLHDKTGVSVESLQRWRVASDDAGNSVDELAGAVNKMQRNLASGNGSAVAALEHMGLTLRELRALSPEEQFETIAAAIAKIQDPAEQVNAAVALFGKNGAEILPTIKRGFNETKDSIVVMSAATVKALDDIGDAWQRLKRSAQSVAGTGVVRLGQQAGLIDSDEVLRVRAEIDAAIDSEKKARGAIPALRFGAVAPGLPSDLDALDAKWKQQEQSILKAAKAAEEYQRKLDAVNLKIREATRDIGNLTEGQKLSANAYKALGLTVEDIGVKLRVSALAVQKFFDEQKDAERLAEHIRRIEEGYAGLSSEIQHVGYVVPPILKEVIKANDDLLKKLKEVEDSETHLGKLFEELPNRVKPQMRDLGNSITRSLEMSLEELPDILARALEGGGGLEAGLKVFYGDLAKRLFGKGGPLYTAISKEMAITNAAILAGLGAAGGFTAPGSRGSNIIQNAQAGAAVGSYFGPYGTAIGAGVGAIRGAFIKPDDEKAAEQQLADFKRSMAALFDVTAMGSVRAQVGTDNWAKMVETVKAAYLATGRTAEDALRDINTAAAHTRDDLEKLPDDLAKINKAIQEQQQDQADLNAAIQKYGFTIEELGPAFQKQELTKQALGLENAFRLLVGAGARADLVIERMGGDINDFIHTALRTGTEVPAEMKPMLEKMVVMGKLTDENGNAITDLGASGITFSETMTQGFDRVVEALKKVLKQLGYIDDATDDLANKPPIHIPIDFPTAPGQAPPELVPQPDVPGFATGSRGWIDFGPEKLVKVHGVERIDTPDTFVAASRRLGTQPIVLQTNLQIEWAVNTIDQQGVKDFIENDGMPAIINMLEDQRRGYGRRLQAALERT